MYNYRQMLDMLDFLEDHDFDASEADDGQWAAVVADALSRGWTPNRTQGA